MKNRELKFKALMYSASLDKYFVSDYLTIDSGLSCLFGFENKGLDELDNRVLCSQKFIKEIEEEYWERDWCHLDNLQGIGINDKYNIEIGEGDIVKTSDGVFIVEYLNSAYGLIKLSGEFYEYICNLCTMGGKIFEILGNKYENKELLK